MAKSEAAKQAARDRAKAWYQNNPERARAQRKKYYELNKQRLLAATKARPGYRSEKQIYDASYRLRREVRLRKQWQEARRRAQRKGVPFTIAFADIVWPEFCPVLGIPLDYSAKGQAGPASPSLDRRVPDLGYVRGNILVISLRANMIKSNATPEELRRVADFFWAMS